MNSKIFNKTEKFKQEYCAEIVRVGELLPIEGADKIARTVIGGYDIVVGKNEVHTGDVVVYCKNETQLIPQFLAANNLFNWGNRDLNDNGIEIEKKLSEGLTEADLRGMCGFFEKTGRVKMIRLKGCPSMGFIFTIEALRKWKPEVFKDVNLEDYLAKEDGVEVPFEFDEIDGERFIKVYVPKIMNTPGAPGSRAEKRNKGLKRFSRIIPETFSFHYDTNPLNDNMWRIKPEDKVCISTKWHGTSSIYSNIPTLNPLPLKWFEKFINLFLPVSKKIQRTEEKYDLVYASRTVIKNQYINENVTPGFYKVDVWKYIADIIKPYVPEDMTIYGEIVGYLPGTSTPIQKTSGAYDYGCEPGECKFMPYRIVTDHEWNATEVYEWTCELMNTIQKTDENAYKHLAPLPIVYIGTLQELYPDIPTDQHWHEAVLERMKNDEKNFGMEKNEPYCKNKVPREGIVIRKEDNTKMAFKLKCLKFYEAEGKNLGKTVDIEMQAEYSDDNTEQE